MHINNRICTQSALLYYQKTLQLLQLLQFSLFVQVSRPSTGSDRQVSRWWWTPKAKACARAEPGTIVQ